MGRAPSSRPNRGPERGPVGPRPQGRGRAGSQDVGHWDIEIRPHLTPYFAYGAAALILAVHLTVGALLKNSSTGVIFQTADQVAIALLGVVIAGVVLLFARPRLRVGAAGVAIRNLLGYRLIPWSEVVDVSFPRGARWARVDLPDDEYIPVLAIQTVDKERAVEAMDRVRVLLERYKRINPH